MNATPPRLVNPDSQPDDRLDQALRPRTLADLIGQERVKENLAILIAAARQLNYPNYHFLF
jgi:Holliday junction DNA helicase RuvB